MRGRISWDVHAEARRGGASRRQRRGAATHSVVSAVIEPSASGIAPVI